jgi:hypothetical protein
MTNYSAMKRLNHPMPFRVFRHFRWKIINCSLLILNWSAATREVCFASCGDACSAAGRRRTIGLMFLSE